MNESMEIKSLENNIKHATAVLELGHCLERLRNNKDFQRVIVNSYFEQESIRLVMLKADPSMQTAALQESIIKQIDAIGALNGYFATVIHLATAAERTIHSDGETLEEILAEGSTL
jgi:hypothetical protein